MAEIDVDKRGTISKEELVEYLATKDHLIKGYHIDLKWLHTDLDNFETKRKGMLNQQEIIQFLATLDSLHHPNIVLK
jgi:Ca2+-binding EF-hand superfamily protein